MATNTGADSTLLFLTDPQASDTGFLAALTKAAPHALCIAQRREEVVGYPAPHLVVFDLDASPESGFDTLRWMRRQPLYRQVPVVAVTSSRESGRIDQAYALGVNSCLIKPEDEISRDAIAAGIGAYSALLRSGSPLAEF